VAIDSSLRRAGDIGMTVESEVVVRRKVDVGFVADDSFRAGDPLVHAKERIRDPEKIRSFANHTDLPEPVELRHIEPRGDDALLFLIAAAHWPLPRSDRRCRRQLRNQLRLRLRRQAEKGAAAVQNATLPQLYRGPVGAAPHRQPHGAQQGQ